MRATDTLDSVTREDGGMPGTSPGMTVGWRLGHVEPWRVEAVEGFWVYILTDQPRGTLYIGVTNDLLARVAAHRRGGGSVFTARYRLKQLVWFEGFADARWAIQREKTMKHYSRDWKINLIERDNHDWEDLYPNLMKQHGLSESDLRIIPANVSKRK